MTKTTTKKDLLWFHVVITALIMFGFGFLPAPEPVTPVGMKMLGVFLGLIYGWSFSTLIWPSLMGMVALVINECVTFKEFLELGFANDTVVFLLFIFIFTAAVEKEGVTKWLASWCISRKILQGRPWMLSFGILLGAAITGGLTNMFAAILIFWGIFYNICKQAGVKPYDKYPTLMVLGIAIASIVGVCIFPFRTASLVALGTYQSLTGISVDYLHFMLFTVPTVVLTLIVYILACRYIFKVDISGLQNINMDFIKPEDLKMNKRQKIVMSFLTVFIILALLPTILPKTFFLTVLLGRLTNTGVIMILLMIMLCIKVDGQPLIDFKELAQQGVIWDMLLLFIIVFPLSSLMMTDPTGLKPFIVGVLQPIFSGVSPFVFMFAALLLPTLLTNFANNIVVAVIFLQLICSMAEPLGVNSTPMILTLMICANFAFYTPAASAPAAMVFGNVEWIKPKDIYTMGGLMMVILALVLITFGLFWGNLIF